MENLEGSGAQAALTIEIGPTTKAVEYLYDGLGRRIGKSVDEDGDGFMDRSQTFVYDGAGLLAASGGSIQISGQGRAANQSNSGTLIDANHH